MTVSDADGIVLDRVDDVVEPGVSRTVDGPEYDAGRYTIQVQGDDWASGGPWDPAVCPAFLLVTTIDETDDVPSVSTESTCLTAQ